MRLNFSGSTDEKIREGVRRIGAVVQEQVALYGTLTGAHPVPRPTAAPAEPDARMADVLPLPARRQSESGGSARA
jgi:2-aminoadipate transaminase